MYDVNSPTTCFGTEVVFSTPLDVNELMPASGICKEVKEELEEE